MMKEKMMKIGNILLNVCGFFWCISAIIAAIMKENAVAFILCAILLCPVLYWVIREKLGEKYRVVAWLYRGFALIVVVWFFLYFMMVTKYYRCFDFGVRREVKAYYEEHLAKEESEFREIRSITKQEWMDYYKIYTTIEYVDGESGKKVNQDVVLYFDRILNRYHEKFDDLVVCRKENPDLILGPTLNVEGDELYAKIEEAVSLYVDNDFASWQMRAEPSLMENVTIEDWKAWQEKRAELGEYKRIENMESSWEVTEDGRNYERVCLDLTLRFSMGTVTLHVALGEDLQMKEFEVK